LIFFCRRFPYGSLYLKKNKHTHKVALIHAILSQAPIQQGLSLKGLMFEKSFVKHCGGFNQLFLRSFNIFRIARN
ncbi:MAG: hypothetical protein IIT91_00330, partial [Aeriscardovia sp.]|nr:hypothetical protein [Aeriscardovia sp.]